MADSSDRADMFLSPLARELWGRIYPNAPVARPQRLPPCVQRLRVFFYNLTDEFHASLLHAMERERGLANCDYARSPCVETTHSGSGKDWDYSNLRQ